MKKLLFIILTLTFHMSLAQSDSALPDYKYAVERLTIFDDIEIAYVDEGAKDLPILLFIHGLGGNIMHWYPTIDELSSNFRCIAIDLPGYGLSTIRDFDSNDYIDFFSKTIDAFVRKIEGKEITLVGHSMGGQVSIAVALNNPKWLKTLVLAAPAGFETFTKEEGDLLKQYAAAPLLMNHNEAQIRAAYQMNFVEMPPLAEEMIQDRLNAKTADWFEAYAIVREKAVKGMLDHPVADDLKSIEYKTYVLFGANDKLIPNKYLHPNLTTDKVANRGKEIPNAEIMMIEEAGHILQIDNPSAFNKLLQNILTKQ
ncbi:MAG: alpha/beta hydrolase [Cyclobacteriaceae bacterium]